MFSVIFTDRYVSDLLKNYQSIFQPFINKGLLCFCPWDRTKSGIYDGISSSLFDCIRGHQEWQGIVLSVDSIFNYLFGEVPDSTHPFDFSAQSEDKTSSESTISYIRLAHILCGFPEISVDYVRCKKYFDEKQQKTIYIPLDEFTQARRDALLDEDPNLRIEDDVMPAAQDDEHLAENGWLRRYYEFQGDRPQRVVYIGTRSRSDERSYSMTSLEFRTLEKRQADWKKNRYPANCRFLVYDFSKRESASFLQDLTEFWYAILTFCINDFSSDQLKSQYLYRLGIDLDPSEFVHALGEHLDLLSMGETYLQRELARITEAAHTTDIRFIRDMPVGRRSEDEDEDAEDDKAQKKADSPFDEDVCGRKAIDLAAVALRRSIHGHQEHQEPIVLDDYQRMYLEQKIQDYELLVFQRRPLQCEMRSSAIEMEKPDRAPAKNPPADASTHKGLLVFIVILLTIVMILLAYVLVFMMLPPTEKIVVAVMFAICLLVCGYCGYRLNQRATPKDERINSEASEQDSHTMTSETLYEDYFTAINTLMYLRSVQDHALMRDKLCERKVQTIKNQIQVIRHIQEIEREIYHKYGHRTYIQTSVPKDISFNYEIEPLTNNPFYCLKPETEEDGLLLNEDGSSGMAPYPFVSVFHLIKEENMG